MTDLESIKRAVMKKPWIEGICAVCDKHVVSIYDGGDGLTTDSLFLFEMRDRVPIGHRLNVVHGECLKKNGLSWVSMLGGNV